MVPAPYLKYRGDDEREDRKAPIVAMLGFRGPLWIVLLRVVAQAEDIQPAVDLNGGQQ